MSWPVLSSVCAQLGLGAHALPCARVTKVMDDPHRHRSGTAAAPWRVPAYVAAPIVLACALLGYGISLWVPLYPAPTSLQRPRPAPAANTGAVETLPANPVESPRVVVRSAASADLSPAPAKIEPAVANPPPKPAEETGAEPNVVPSAAAPAEESRPEPQVRRVPRKVRRVYRRPTPKPPAGPVEALFSALTK